MLDQLRPSTQKLNQKNQQTITRNMPPLISFEPEEDEVIQFQSDYASQVYDIQYSVISTQTEKKKKQMRQKVNQYLNHRKTLGAVKKPNRMTYMEQEQQIGGDILDELVLIDQDQKKLDQAEQFILQFNKNPDNAINNYIKKGFIHSDQPEVIAAYLLKSEGLDKQRLGKFFGENNQKTLKILHSYCKLLNFKNIQFDRALRILLSKFRLPGQSQQIERVVWQFSQSFFQTNQEDYDNPDQLFPLAYAIIMLGTDAHNPKQQKKMSRQQFVTNTHGACPSISKKYLANIYDRILSQKFQTEVSDFQNIYTRLTDINMSDFQNALKLTKQLKKGDIFVKACRNTNKMVQRKIYLSDDQQRIYWKSINQDDWEQPRFIQIKDITDLTLGLGSQVMKKNKVPQEFDPMCFTIQTTHRTLDLKAKTNKQRAKWLNYIRAVLIKRRQLRIQFLENSKKNKLQRQDIQEIWNTQIFPNWDLHWDYKNKKPLVKNVLVRGIQAICCCWKKRPKTSDGLQQSHSHGLQIKTSKLETLWKMGLPDNSRKVLWPLIIGNNLALNSTMIQQVKKRTKFDSNLRKFSAFDVEAIEMGQICRQFRPDLPAIRQLLVISSIFVKAIPKNQTSNQTANAGLISFINLLHLGHFLPFYRGEKNEIDLKIQLFEYLLQKNSLKVKQHLEVIKLQTRMYLVSWFLSVFSDCFAHEQAFLLRLWDNFLLEGEIYLFKIGITIVKYYQVQLKMCTFHQGIKVLRFPKNTSPILFFHILNNQIDVKQEYFNSYIDVRKHAIIKTKVQAIPLE